MRLSAEAQAGIEAAGLPPARVEEVARHALQEDLAGGVDLTTEATVPTTRDDIGDIRARAAGVVAGIPVAAAVFDMCLNGGGLVNGRVSDGSAVQPGDVVLTASGPTRELLTAERTALNLISHLSGVATLTRRWVDTVARAHTVVRDTRKTLPGLRDLEKYAVRRGGGSNHRMGLSDAALIKDNHIRAAGGVTAALAAVQGRYPAVTCQVECDTTEQVREALDAGADLVLLDNMSPPELREATRLAHAAGARTEASGGLRLDMAAEVAAAGVDFLAVGALTHSAPALDLGFDLR